MLTTGFGLDPMLRRAGWITLLTTDFDSIGHHVRKPEFDSRIGHHVKKSKRGACKHKAATVRRTTT